MLKMKRLSGNRSLSNNCYFSGCRLCHISLALPLFSGKSGKARLGAAIMSSTTNSEQAVLPQKKEEKSKKKRLPGFIKSLFSANIDASMFFPYPQPSKEEQEEIETFVKE